MTYHNEPGAENQIIGTEDMINTGVREKIVMGIHEIAGQFR
jgi:hypothetical protein